MDLTKSNLAAQENPGATKPSEIAARRWTDAVRVEAVQAREHQQLRAFLEVLQAHLFTEESCGAQARKQPRNPRHAKTYSVKAGLRVGL